MTCDIAMILEVLKARSTGVSAIPRDDSTLEPRQIQAAGSDTWPSPPEPAQVVIDRKNTSQYISVPSWNLEIFIWYDDL